ncbi:MAG: type II toxin-antitoxin system RelE/ParE family toxin [Oscillospiraceae bacterium]
MPQVKISPLASQDLKEIKKYISTDLESPQAAAKIIKQILKRIKDLEDFPQAGGNLSLIIKTQTNYRYVIVGNYIVFYRFENNVVFIVRILYGKRDYIDVLFNPTNMK